MSTTKTTEFARAMALALPSLCLLCSQAHAADKVGTLPSVTVNAAALDAQTLGRSSTQSKAALAPKVAATSDTASLLSAVPGLSINGAGGVSGLPSIHGLADDRLRIQVDGMDLIASCPNHMNPALSYLDPSNVGLLKVYAGITPVSAGGDSIGGTIIAESRAPEFAAPGQAAITKGELGAFYRSNNKASGANLSATYASDAFHIGYSASTSKADNYTAGADFKSYDFTGRVGHTLPRNEVGSSAYETRNQSLTLAFKNENHLLEARLGAQDMPEQLYPNQRMDLLKNNQHSVNLRYTGAFDWGMLQARAYQEDVDHFMDFGDDKRFWYGTASGGPTALAGTPCSPMSAACAAGMPMYTVGKTNGLSIKGELPLTPQDLLRVGAEVQTYRINDYWTPSGAMMMPGTFLNIKDGERDRSAVFGEWEAQKGTQWMTLLGARVEQVKMNAGNVVGYAATNAMNSFQTRDSSNFNALDHHATDNNVDLTALAKYTANANYDIEFGFAHKVRSPNVYERYTWSSWQMAALMNNFVGDGNGYIGNIDLKPEKAHTLSATFDWHAADRNWGFKATPDYTKVQDYIDAIRCTRSACRTIPSNATTTNQFVILEYANQSARLYGIDLSGYMPLASTGAGDFSLKGLINYTKGENRDTGDDLYNIMPLNAKLVIGQKLAGWDNAVELIAVKGKDDGSEVRNEIKTPGYGVTNLRASYTWKQVRIDFGVENLFDKLYTLPQGGAYVGQGTTMSTNGVPWGIGVPGMGRSIYTGFNLKF